MKENMQTIYRTLLREWTLLAPGTAVPGEYELAGRFGVNRMLIHRVGERIARDGLIVRHRRMGSFRSDLSESAVRKLRCGASGHVALVHAIRHSPIHWTDVTLRVAEHYLTGIGMKVSRLPVADEEWRNPDRFLGELERSGVGRAVLLPKSLAWPPEAFRSLRESPLKLVLYNYTSSSVPLPDIPMVCADDFGDGVLMGRLLRENGFNRVMMAGAPEACSWNTQRHMGLCEGLRREVPLIECRRENMDLIHDFAQCGGAEAVLVSTHCEYAAACAEYLTRHQLRYGHDYSLITFADNPNFAKYRFSAMAFPAEQVGSLLGRLAAGTAELPEECASVHWIVRSNPVMRGSMIRSLC